MAMDKGKEAFETFDSGDGPIAGKAKSDSDHRDSAGGLSHVKTDPADIQKEEN